MFKKKIWDAIGNKSNCAFNLPAKPAMLCKHKYNVTGYCNEFSCPLANSKYATVREEYGNLYLFVKEPERVHSPKHMYEKILLSNNYEKALKEIEEHLEFWDKEIIHKCKQKMTTLYEYLERLEKIKKTGVKKYIVRNVKSNRREKIRALKALNTANFEKEIGEELMKRLETGIYGEEARLKYHYAKEKEEKEKRKKYVTDFEESAEDDRQLRIKRKRKKMEKQKEKEKIEW